MQYHRLNKLKPEVCTATNKNVCVCVCVEFCWYSSSLFIFLHLSLFSEWTDHQGMVCIDQWTHNIYTHKLIEHTRIPNERSSYSILQLSSIAPSIHYTHHFAASLFLYKKHTQQLLIKFLHLIWSGNIVCVRTV